MVEEDTRKLLYEGDRIKIYQASVPNEHDIEAGSLYCYFGRDLLKQLSQRDVSGLRQDLENINSDFLYGLRKQGISLEGLGWALSKARINELEQEVSYFINQYHEAKSALEERD